MVKVLVTSGGTTNPIDDVRWVGNISTGRFGCRVATAFLNRGHQVILLHASRSVVPNQVTVDLSTDVEKQIEAIRTQAQQWAEVRDRYQGQTYDTFESYERKLEKLLVEQRPEIVVLAAAVADYVPEPQTGKISSAPQTLNLPLRRTPKVIAKVRDWHPSVFLVGFKLLSGSTEEVLIATAQRALQTNRADVIAGNDLQTMLRGNHTFHLVRQGQSTETYNSIDDDPAERLAERVLQWYHERPGSA